MQNDDGPGGTGAAGPRSHNRIPTEGRPTTEVAPRRPMFERLGLAFVAIVLAALFAAIGLAAWSGGEVFLAAMGGIGCLMTLWVGTLTLFRS